MEHNINPETTTTVDIQRENIYSSSSNNYCIYNNGGLTTSGLKPTYFRESIRGGLLHWINSSSPFLFLFSGVLYVLQKKTKSLFTLYRWFFWLWYKHKDLKWWHPFLCQGVCNLYISWYLRDLCNFFSLNHFSQNSHHYAKSIVQNLGWGMHRVIVTGIVCFVEDFDVITLVFQLQYL